MILKTTIGDSNHQFKKTKVKKPSHQKYLSLIIKTITGDSINYQISTMISFDALEVEHPLIVGKVVVHSTLTEY